MLALRACQDNDLPPQKVPLVRESGYLPPQWKSYFLRPSFLQDSPWGQHYTEAERSGIAISNPLPPLAAGQEFQLPFLVAWADADKVSCATSLAVEARPAQILAGGQCV